MTYTDPSACLLDLQSGLPKPLPPTPTAKSAAPASAAAGAAVVGGAGGGGASKEKTEVAKLTEAVAKLSAQEEARHSTLMAQVQSFNWVNEVAKVIVL